MHARAHFPYPFQRYPLNERGALEIPEDRLRALLDTETSVYLVRRGRRLETATDEGVYTLDLEILPPAGDEPLPAWVSDRFDTSEWIGRDGRRASVNWLNR